ncbi:hypothetical protein KEM52_004788 [Ascosphaera acerosa]|nr:hypothetical protein KEM52_004788 [Ascosphaera acerosa]
MKLVDDCSGHKDEDDFSDLDFAVNAFTMGSNEARDKKASKKGRRPGTATSTTAATTSVTVNNGVGVDVDVRVNVDPRAVADVDVEVGAASSPRPVHATLAREEFDIDMLSDLGSPPSYAEASSSSIWRRPFRDVSWPRPRFRRPGSPQQIIKSVWRWCHGPSEPEKHAIKPWYADYQLAPLHLRDMVIRTRRQKICLLLFYFLAWGCAFAFTYGNWKAMPARLTPDYGMPVRGLTCDSVFWKPKNECGMNGDLCRPFTGPMAFRCPSRCKEIKLLNPHAVGTEEVNYQPLVIGGPIYRGDSYLCAAAMHAGIISNKDGGCGVINRIGEHTGYNASDAHGLSSIGYDSTFPLAFEFRPGSGSRCNGRDQQWGLLAISVFFAILITLFTANPAVWFATIFIIVFVQTGLVSDPPEFGNLSVAEAISKLFGRMLPAAFVCAVMFHFYIRRTMQDNNAMFEKAVFWLGPCWFGALNNHTFDRWIPIARLTGSDLAQQPGALTALTIILIILVTIAIGQIWMFQREGRLIRYLQLYLLFAALIAIGVVIPSLSLRIHHYILALLLLPGTSMQTRLSMIYQGLLVGLFINGVARWDFASILETAEHLRDNGPFDSALPAVAEPVITIGALVSTIAFNVSVPDVMSGLEGLTVLVNDVERFRTGFRFDEENVTFEHWRDNSVRVPDYIRFGYYEKDGALDYTQASTWNVDGTWTRMQDGPS